MMKETTKKGKLQLDMETKMKMMRELFGEDVRVFVEVRQGDMQFIGVERSNPPESEKEKQQAFDITTKERKRPDYYG